jgi:hypothetical protein
VAGGQSYIAIKAASLKIQSAHDMRPSKAQSLGMERPVFDQQLLSDQFCADRTIKAFRIGQFAITNRNSVWCIYLVDKLLFCGGKRAKGL